MTSKKAINLNKYTSNNSKSAENVLSSPALRERSGEGNKSRARELRIQQTHAEKCLWNCLRNRRLEGFKFRRQHNIDKYIVDFICTEKKIIVEIDGGQHQEQIYYDNERTIFLEKFGFKVIRFWNNEVLQQLNAVLEVIVEYLKSPHPTLSPMRGEGEKCLSHKNGRGELQQASRQCQF